MKNGICQKLCYSFLSQTTKIGNFHFLFLSTLVLGTHLPCCEEVQLAHGETHRRQTKALAHSPRASQGDSQHKLSSHIVSHYLLPPRVCISRKLVSEAELGLEISSLIWDAGVPGGILTDAIKHLP